MSKQITIGALNASAMYVGSKAARAVYVGDTKVWPVNAYRITAGDLYGADNVTFICYSYSPDCQPNNAVEDGGIMLEENTKIYINLYSYSEMYEVDHWVINGVSYNTPVVEITVNSSIYIQCYAKAIEYEVTKWVIHFDANGANSGSVPSDIVFNSLTDTTWGNGDGTLVKQDYTFGGWSSIQASSVDNPRIVYSKSNIDDANWSGAESTGKWTFAQWCTKTGANIDYLDNVKGTKTLVLYAQWAEADADAKKFKIIFMANNGTDAVTVTKELRSETATYLGHGTVPTYSGHSFGGWSAIQASNINNPRVAYYKSDVTASGWETDVRVTSSWTISQWCQYTMNNFASLDDLPVVDGYYILYLYAQWSDN